MKKGFIPLENYVRFRTAVSVVENRGADEAGLLLVTGDPGTGKSRSVHRYAAEHNAMYLRTPSVINAKGLMQALAATDRALPQKGSALELQQAIIRQLNRTRRPLIIDECQHLAKGNGLMLEAVRDINDMTGGVCVLVAGELGVEQKIAQFPQIATRISAVVEFQPLALAEVGKAVRLMTDVTFDDALIVELHKQSNGKMRLIVNGVAELEAFAQANNLTELTKSQIIGKDICYKWEPSDPNPPKRGTK